MATRRSQKSGTATTAPAGGGTGPAEDRYRYLAEASQLLAESLEYEPTLARVARLAVPCLADWAAVDVIGADGEVRRLAVAHVDPAKVELAHELWRRYPPKPEDRAGLTNVLRTGRPEFYPEIGDELMEAVAHDAEHLRIVRELGLRSGLVVPMIARGRTLGAVTFVMAESGRRYTADDLSFAEDLARRAAVAVDNARLVREARAAEEARRGYEEQFRTLTDAMPQLVWATDENGSHTYFNRRWYEFTGLSEGESLGFGFTNALHPDDKARTLARWESAWRDGEAYEIEYRFRGRDGVYRWFLGRAAPVRDHSGRVTQWVGTCTDIEEQKQMEALLARLNAERERMLEEVSTPVFPVLDGVLVMPLIGSLDTVRMERATRTALEAVTRANARTLVIDITGARVVDSHAVANLSNLVGALRLVGAEPLVTGVGAHVAQNLVGLGLDLTEMRTHRTLALALASLIRAGGGLGSRHKGT